MGSTGATEMKIRTQRHTVLATFLAATSAGLAGVVNAQSDETQAATAVAGLEEITVTAQRREQDLQSVPLAITAVTGATLERMDVRNVSDLSHHVPGLTLCCQRGEVQYPFIRGVPGVKGYFAEVPTVLDGNAFYF